MDDRIRDTINHSFNVILLYYAIDERVSFVDSNGYSVQDIKTYVEYWMKLLDMKKFMLVLVANKLDVENDGDRVVTNIEGESLAKSWGNVPFIEVSAKSGENIKELLDIICNIYTRRFEEIDGDLAEAALFDEDKVNTKTIVKEDEDYEEYVERKEPETFEEIMMQQNELNVPNQLQEEQETKQEHYDRVDAYDTKSDELESKNEETTVDKHDTQV
eukprot:UN08307